MHSLADTNPPHLPKSPSDDLKGSLFFTIGTQGGIININSSDIKLSVIKYLRTCHGFFVFSIHTPYTAVCAAQ